MYVTSYVEIDYNKKPLLPICEEDDVAVMYGRAILDILPYLQKLITIWRCMHRASSYNMYINQQDAQNSYD